MPNQFGLVDNTLASFMMGNARVMRPTAVTATPLQTLGLLKSAKLEIKGDRVDLQTDLPKFTLRSWQIGAGAILSGEIREVIAPVNLDMFLGAAHSDVSAYTGVLLASAYTAGDQTLTITGDVGANFPVPGLAHITETGVGSEDFVVAKVELDTTNTKITLPLGSTLVNDYTTAATVSRAAYTSNGFGRVQQITDGVGAIWFDSFAPTAGQTFQAILMTCWKMQLPLDLSLDLVGSEPMTNPFSVGIIADPTKPNGQTLGKIDIYTLTAS